MEWCNLILPSEYSLYLRNSIIAVKMNLIQVGFLVSYDYELLKKALPPVYKESDTIFLAIDKDRKTWNGSDLEIPDTFFDWVDQFDTEKKIHWYEDHFYQENLTTMECEVRERKMLAEQMGLGNWLVQLDSDEYFLDFKNFTKFLHRNNHFLKNPEKNKVQISPFKINLYKKVNGGMLYVTKPDKFMAATNFPNYKVGRLTRERIIYVQDLVLHETISRSREELETKLDNWGHNTDIDKEAFLEKWEKVDETNYKTMEDFFYLRPEGWKKLSFMPGNTDQELRDHFYKNRKKIEFSKSFIAKKNFGQWFKFRFLK